MPKYITQQSSVRLQNGWERGGGGGCIMEETRHVNIVVTDWFGLIRKTSEIRKKRKA